MFGCPGFWAEEARRVWRNDMGQLCLVWTGAMKLVRNCTKLAVEVSQRRVPIAISKSRREMSPRSVWSESLLMMGKPWYLVVASNRSVTEIYLDVSRGCDSFSEASRAPHGVRRASCRVTGDITCPSA